MLLQRGEGAASSDVSGRNISAEETAANTGAATTRSPATRSVAAASKVMILRSGVNTRSELAARRELAVSPSMEANDVSGQVAANRVAGKKRGVAER